MEKEPTNILAFFIHVRDDECYRGVHVILLYPMNMILFNYFFGCFSNQINVTNYAPMLRIN